MRALACLLLLCLACGDDDGAGTPDAGSGANPDAEMPAADLGPRTYAEELAGFGEFPVGFRELEVTYARPDGDGERTIPYLVWYPASDPGERRVRHPFRNSVVATEDAPPAAGSFPTLAFSHGHLAVAAVATDLCEHLASHGWVVFSPTHVGNTTIDGERTADIYYLRASDVSEALTHLESEPELGPLVGSPKAVSGHSFGGYTALTLAGASLDVDAIVAGCASDPSDPICTDLDDSAEQILRDGLHDPRFDAVIAMAAGDARRFGENGASTVAIPALLMVAEEDGYPAGSAATDPYWNGLANPGDLWVDLLGAGHNTFTDICAMFPAFTRCPEGGYDADLGLELTRLYALAFLRSRLLDDAGASALIAGEPAHSSLEVAAR